jgi:hypothetical protein
VGASPTVKAVPVKMASTKKFAQKKTGSK